MWSSECSGCGGERAEERGGCGHWLCGDCAGEDCPACDAVQRTSCDVCDTEQAAAGLVWCATESVFKCRLCRRACHPAHRLSPFADNLAFRQAYETLRVEVNKERKREAGEVKEAVSGLVSALRAALVSESGRRGADVDRLLAHLSPEEALSALLEPSRPTGSKGHRRPKAAQPKAAQEPLPTPEAKPDAKSDAQDGSARSGLRVEGLSDDERRQQILGFFQPKLGRSRRVLFVEPSRGTLHVLDPFRGKYMRIASALPPLQLAEFGVAQVSKEVLHVSGGREYSQETEAWTTLSGSLELDLSSLQYRFRDRFLLAPTLGHGAAHVRDRLLLFGGVVSGKDKALRLSRDCLVYPDAAGPEVAPLKGSRMLHARRGFSVATAPDHSAVYVLGGRTNAGLQAQGRTDPFFKLINLCERYDPARDVWTALPPLPEPRAEALAACTESGRVMLLGGKVYDAKATCLHSAVPLTGLCLDPRQSRWTKAPDTDLVSVSSDATTNALLVEHPRAGLVLVDGESGRVGVLEERMESWRVLKAAALDLSVRRQLVDAFPLVA